MFNALTVYKKLKSSQKGVNGSTRPIGTHRKLCVLTHPYVCSLNTNLLVAWHMKMQQPDQESTSYHQFQSRVNKNQEFTQTLQKGKMYIWRVLDPLLLPTTWATIPFLLTGGSGLLLALRNIFAFKISKDLQVEKAHLLNFYFKAVLQGSFS